MVCSLHTSQLPNWWVGGGACIYSPTISQKHILWILLRQFFKITGRNRLQNCLPEYFSKKTCILSLAPFFLARSILGCIQMFSCLSIGSRWGLIIKWKWNNYFIGIVIQTGEIKFRSTVIWRDTIFWESNLWLLLRGCLFYLSQTIV